MGLVVFISDGPKFASSVEEFQKYAKYKIILQKYIMFQNNFRSAALANEGSKRTYFIYNKSFFTNRSCLPSFGNGS
jgi:hypothetical protein